MSAERPSNREPSPAELEKRKQEEHAKALKLASRIFDSVDEKIIREAVGATDGLSTKESKERARERIYHVLAGTEPKGYSSDVMAREFADRDIMEAKAKYGKNMDEALMILENDISKKIDLTGTPTGHADDDPEGMTADEYAERQDYMDRRIGEGGGISEDNPPEAEVVSETSSADNSDDDFVTVNGERVRRPTYDLNQDPFKNPDAPNSLNSLEGVPEPDSTVRPEDDPNNNDFFVTVNGERVRRPTYDLNQDPFKNPDAPNSLNSLEGVPEPDSGDSSEVVDGDSDGSEILSEGAGGDSENGEVGGVDDVADDDPVEGEGDLTGGEGDDAGAGDGEGGDNGGEDDPETPPEIPSNPDERKKLAWVMVNRSEDARMWARAYADQRMEEEAAKTGGGFKGLISKIWKGNLMEGYYRQKYINEAIETMKNRNDIMALEDDGANKAIKDRLAVLEKFQNDYEESIHKDAGEKRDEIVDVAKTDQVKDLLKQFAEGRISREDLNVRRNEIMMGIMESAAGDKLPIIATTDNFFDIAENVKYAMEHGEDMDRVLEGFRLISGENRSDARASEKFGKVDKLIDKLRKSRLGSVLVNEATIGIAVGIATSTLTKTIAKMGAGVAVGAASVATGGVIAATLAGAGSAGLYAGLKESAKVKQERARVLEQHAIGESIGESKTLEEKMAGMTFKNERARKRYEKRYKKGEAWREKLEGTAYQMESAGNLRDILEFDVANKLADFLENPEATDGSSINIGAMFASLANVEARVKMSDSETLPLISYTSREGITEERFDLDQARAEAKVQIKRFMDASTDPAVRAAIAAAGGIDEYVNGRLRSEVNGVMDILEDSTDKQDKAFNSIRRRKAILRGVKTAGVSLLVGQAFQEASAFFDPNKVGFVEKLVNPNASGHNVTFLGAVAGKFTKESVTDTLHVGASDTMDTYNVNGKNINISSDSKLVDTDGDGIYEIVNANGDTVGHVEFGSDGLPTKESVAALEAVGMKYDVSEVPASGHYVDGEEHITSGVKTMNVRDDPDFANQLGRAHRVAWANGRTEPFDGDELTAYWTNSGDQYHWEGKGDFLEMALKDSGRWNAFVEEGFVEPGGHIDKAVVQKLFEAGRIDFAITPADGMSGTPIFVDTDPLTHATLIGGSEDIARQFVPGGSKFLGRFGEFVFRVDGDGGSDIIPLATDIGKGLDAVTGAFETITRDPPKWVPDFAQEASIITAGHDIINTTIADRIVETPWVVPLPYARDHLNPLERRGRRPAPRNGYYNYGYEQGYRGDYVDRHAEQQAERQRLLGEASPRLQQNSDAELNPREELDWYRGQLQNNRGADYVAGLDNTIDNTPELKSVDSEIRSVTTIPVKADGEQDNIYKTLSLYAQQSGDVSRTNLILLHVNWKDTILSNPQSVANRDKTIEEIRRAQRDFPQLRIAMDLHEYKSAEVDDVDENGKVINSRITGEIAMRKNDLALMTLQKAIAEGRMSADHDALIIHNDADAKGLSRSYIKNMQDGMSKYANTDLFTGTTRFGTELHDQLPGYGVVTNFLQTLNIAGAYSGRVHTAGANFAFKASTYAAVNGLGSGGRRGGGGGSDDVAVGERIAAIRAGSTENPANGAGGYYYNRAFNPINKNVLRRLPGAYIDTDPDRYRKPYVRGLSVHEGYNDYNTGASRTDGLTQAEVSFSENIADRISFNEMVRKIELNMADIIRVDGVELAKKGLRFMFPLDSYDPITRIEYRTGADGRTERVEIPTGEFKFTSSGKKWLRTRLAGEGGVSYYAQKHENLYRERMVKPL